LGREVSLRSARRRSQGPATQKQRLCQLPLAGSEHILTHEYAQLIPRHRDFAPMPAVGSSVARKDGIGKATGAAKYADDISFPGMLHGRTIRSTIPCGRIKSIRFDFDTTGFTIVDYRDVPAKNAVDLMAQDQPFLAEREVRHMAEPVVLLAHEDKEKVNAANVIIEYDEEQALFDPEKSTVVFESVEFR
jgi:xanthine dehydrogenase molybdopterin-binding subunit B